MENLKTLLDRECKSRNTTSELSLEKPDPVWIAKKHNNEIISLICALFAYGNAHQIVKFLQSLDFCLLDKSEDEIAKKLEKKIYRFQNSKDVQTFFISLRRLKLKNSLQNIFLEKYNQEKNVIHGIRNMIDAIYSFSPEENKNSKGYKFLIGNSSNNNSPLKRWNLFLRWMVRKDHIDMGLWQGVDKAKLCIPLDVHTFNVSKKLGLLQRKSYDLKAALELTETLRKFDSTDPIKYDFAIYRIGQEKNISKFVL